MARRKRKHGMVTMKDIAERVGVAQSTVSAVLNNRPYCYISQAKREKIVQTARELNYIPNQMSRALRGISIRTIGLINSPFSSQPQNDLTRHITNELWRRDYQVMSLYSHKREEADRKMVQNLVGFGVDGLIVHTDQLVGDLAEMVPSHLPAVCFNHHGEDCDAFIDRHRGGELAARHLFDLGHRRLAFMASEIDSNIEKLAGFRDAHIDAEIPWEDSHTITYGEFVDDGLRTITDRIRRGGITGVFTYNDITAAQLLRHLQQEGIRVPEEVSIVGFDGENFTRWVLPTITTIRQPSEKLAHALVSRLVDQLQGMKVPSEPDVIEPELQEGGSTGAVRESSQEAAVGSQGQDGG